MNLNLLVVLTIVVLLTIFVMVLIDKWIYNRLNFDKIKSRLFFKLIECKFCQSFWISLFITIVFYIVFRNNYFVLIPFMSAAVIWRID